ncbi:non-ribosomal peptide synthetase [Pantoea ananatis]|uniref:non-ribosomal peptide synthetase n=1 Tax=Pantoea ananas TaxID=553 RepID=UPI001B30959B|nr:non-ribosomal peptide synthetase [Pantoea ananatis]
MQDNDLKNVLRTIRGRFSHKNAIVFNEMVCSYQELERRIEICNQAISCSDTAVIINVKDKLKAIILMLAAIDCGVTFIPVDGDRPRSFLTKIATKFPLIRVINDVCFDTGQVVSHPLTHHGHAQVLHRALEQGVMSVMYTSGSTGEPKGVQVRASSVLNLLHRPSFISLSDEDVVASYSSLSFDASTFEIFTPLLSGGTLVLLDKMVVLDEARLLHAIDRYGITCMWMTAGLFRSHMLSGDCRALARLRHLIVGGDKVDFNAAVSFLERSPNTQLYNGYGPTENTVFTTVALLDLHKLKREKRVPTGKLVRGSEHLLFDEHTGEYHKLGIGRLHVTGRGLSLGYHDNPVETDKVFMIIDGTRYYDTGDIVECTSECEFYFLGRQDRQVKLNGHRVELDDIEKTLENDRSIVKALCFIWNSHLVSLIEIHDETADLDTIATRLRAQLSSFSFPDFLIENTQWPLTKNGKLDTKSLINQTINYLEMRQNDSTECSVKSVAEQVLDKPVEMLDAGLFELGFDSISMLTFSYELNKKFDIKINLLDLYSAGTLQGVDDLVNNKVNA